jgi:hypothetical protein
MITISKLIQGAGSLGVLHRGEIVKAEDTFVKRQVREGECVVLVKSEQKIMRWHRFTKYHHESSMVLYQNQWDALAFIPKVDITLLGFGFFN